MHPKARNEFLDSLDESEAYCLEHSWDFWARPNQLAPSGNWFCWLVLAGRGFGKTRMGVEWIRGKVEGDTPLTAPPGAPARIAIISKKASENRDVIVQGESGFDAICPADMRPKFMFNKQLTWPNGIKAFLYTAEEPDELRGPQHQLAWGDELAKWKYPDDAWANLMFGLRLGDNPLVMVTTTPKPTKLIKRLVKAKNTFVTTGSSYENRENLAVAFYNEAIAPYEGTRLGRQEIYGEILEDIPGALWDRKMIDDARVKKAPDLARIVVAVDPPVSHGESADECGLVVAGIAANDHYYILDDRTSHRLTPQQWGGKTINAYYDFKADRVVAEINNGGDLIETLMRQLDPKISYKSVRATRGKILRAEPVASLYERGMVHHVGAFPDLEDQLCTYTGDPREKSPDRLDALVWAITDLMQPEKRMRFL